MNNFNNYILLLRGHLVVAREAKTPFENVSTHVHASSFDIRVRSAPTVTFGSNELVGPVDRLNMHGLPYRSSLRLKGGNSGQDFTRRRFAYFVLPELVPFSPYVRSHCILVDETAGKPEVGDTVLFIEGIHGDREVFQAFFISVIDSFLLGNMLVQVWNLASDDARHDVAHAVVMADLLMLVQQFE